MKTYQAADIRNVAIVGHASCGKTMLTESMLMSAGVINRLGNIQNGSTVSDYHEEEQQRLISIHTSLLSFEWKEKKFNVLDTPGYLDFICESLSALRVADMALVVVHANHGVSIGTEQTWKIATKNEIPRIIILNALDKENIDLDGIISQLKASFGERILPLTFPVNPGPGFNKVLDVLTKEVSTYADANGKPQSIAADGALKEQTDSLHQQLLEFVAESNDALLEKFFESGSLTEEEMRNGLHTALMKQTFIPLFVTSAETNVGIDKLLDFITQFGATPLDKPTFKATDANGNEVKLSVNDSDPVLYIFKTVSEPQFGDMSYFRVFCGKIEVGMDLYNADTKTTERLGQIYSLIGKTRIPQNSMGAGDIGATVKLKSTHTSNTLCSPKRIVTLPKVIYPKPNIHSAIKLQSKGEEDKLAQGLAALHNEDPTFVFNVDSELHQTVISAQGSLHLEVVADRLRKRFKLEIELTEPRVRYRETIKSKADAKYRHKKQTGGAGQFGEVWLRVEPKPRDTGVEFIQSLTGQNVDRVFVPSVEKGVMRACQEGILAGYRVVDVKIDFYDGKMHPVDSNDISFQIAGYFAFKEAFLNAKPCLLEPIYNVEIRIPEDCMGKVMGDLSSRRGKIIGMDTDGNLQVIKAQVPAKELYRYSSTLRSLTGGRGIHQEEFSHYEEMPRELEQKVIEEAKARKEKAHAEK